MKKLAAIFLSALLAFTPLSAATQLFTIDEFRGLQRNPGADKIETGGHSKFNNAYIHDGNVRLIKGRDRLNSTANADTTVNMLCYYENGAGTTKKLVVKETDEVVTYTTSGGSRTQIASSLTDEIANCVQVGDIFYFSSSTDGLYEWPGAGSASAVPGVSAPSAPTLSHPAGGSWGDLDVAVCYSYKTSFYSKTLGIETEASSSTEFTNSAGDNVITVNRGTAPAAPFDTHKVYRTVGGGTTNAQCQKDYFFLRVQDDQSLDDPTADEGLGDPLDVTLDTITPPSLPYITEYKGSLFLAENTEVRFSRLAVQVDDDADTYWLETDMVDVGSSIPITGMATTFNSLLVFTSNRILEISGFGVDSFRLTTFVEGIGAVSNNTIITDNKGDIFFFSGTRGVYKVRVSEKRADELIGTVIDPQDAQLVRLSAPWLDDVFRGIDDQIDLDPADFESAHAYYDADFDLYFLYIDEHCFMFDNLNQQWTYIPGAQFADSVFTKSPSADGAGILMDDLGFFYQNWTGYENGIESGTVTGNPTSSTSTTLVDTGATFNTTDDGLEGVWVVLDNSSSLPYRRITSNTATELTISPAWDTNPITADTYYVAYIVFDVLTKQLSLSKPPKQINIEALTLTHEKSDSTQNLTMTLYKDKATTSNSSKTFDLSSRFVDKKLLSDRGYWLQGGFRSFVYNTSNTINPPVNVINYSLRATEFQED